MLASNLAIPTVRFCMAATPPLRMPATTLNPYPPLLQRFAGNAAMECAEWDDSVEGGGSPLSKGETLVADGGYEEEYQEEEYL